MHGQKDALGISSTKNSAAWNAPLTVRGSIGGASTCVDISGSGYPGARDRAGGTRRPLAALRRDTPRDIRSKVGASAYGRGSEALGASLAAASGARNSVRASAYPAPSTASAGHPRTSLPPGAVASPRPEGSIHPDRLRPGREARCGQLRRAYLTACPGRQRLSDGARRCAAGDPVRRPGPQSERSCAAAAPPYRRLRLLAAA